MDPLIVVDIKRMVLLTLGLGILVLYLNFENLQEIFKGFVRWFKGSRKNYYLSDGIIRGLEPGVSYRGAISTPIIEIRKILWWYRGKVHGTFGLWQITKVGRHGSDYDIQLGWERREDLGSALRLMNAYSRPLALHEMLNRTEDLEKQLEKAEDFRAEWRAAIRAISKMIDAFRQLCRSKSSERIRKWLEVVEHSATSHGEPEPPEEKVTAWMRGLPFLIKPS